MFALAFSIAFLVTILWLSYHTPQQPSVWTDYQRQEASRYRRVGGTFVKIGEED